MIQIKSRGADFLPWVCSLSLTINNKAKKGKNMRHEITIKENSSVDELIKKLRILQEIHDRKKLIISSVFNGDVIIEEEKND